MTKPILVTDIDGVVLKWQSTFLFWCSTKGIQLDEIRASILDEQFRTTADFTGTVYGDPALYDSLIKEFHESEMGWMFQAYDDALEYIPVLAKKFDLIAVTAFGESTKSYMNRARNLEILFPRMFKQVICTGMDKREAFGRVRREAASNNAKIVGYIDDIDKHLQHFVSDFVAYHKPHLFHMLRGYNKDDMNNRKFGVTNVSGFADIVQKLMKD